MSCVAIIDDSVVVRKIVEASLGRAGIKCLTFSDGYEALRAFSRHPTQVPDLIFLDINLPCIDGFDLLKLFKSHSSFEQITIVMLSSRDRVVDRLKCRLAGARNYLVKPFRTQDLLAIATLYLAEVPLRPADASERSASFSF